MALPKLGDLSAVNTSTGAAVLTYSSDSATTAGSLVVEPGGNVRFVAVTPGEEDLLDRSRAIAAAAGVSLPDDAYPGAYVS